MVTGWLKKGGQKYYFNNNGVMATRFYRIGNKLYDFNKDTGALICQLENGLYLIDDNLYYVKENGKLAKGMYTFKLDSGNEYTCYFGKNYNSISTKKTIDGITYVFEWDKGLVESYIDVDETEFVNSYLELKNMKLTNLGKDALSYEYKCTGTIKNTSQKKLDIYVHATFYDKNGDVIEDRLIVSCSNLKPGKSYTFENTMYFDREVYDIEFSETNVYKS